MPAGWNAPVLRTTGTIITADIWNDDNYYNPRYLKGIGSVVTIQSGLIVDNSLGSEYLKLPPLTTAQIGTALATTTGRCAFDSTVSRIKFYDGTAIRAVVSTVDVDDTPVNGATTDPVSSNWAYDFKNVVTATGDMRYATAAGVETRLGIGTALQLFRTNAGATAPEWATVAGLSLRTGNYTGNGAANRSVAHGAGTTPTIVFIVSADSAGEYKILSNYAAIWFQMVDTTSGNYAVTAMDATNFYVGNASSYAKSANVNGHEYYWVAIA